MASGSSAGKPDLGELPSAAEKLPQMHSGHHQATIEDVPDEDSKPAPGVEDASEGGPTPSWAPAMSAKAAGKQKAQEPTVALDTQSHELFPELGASKKGSANVAPIWSAKSSADGKTNGKTNGANETNGAPRPFPSSTGAATPATAANSVQRGPPALSIPGRNVETITLESEDIIPRAQLKRPIPDIIKDINRRSRANITMAPSAGGRMRFDATGPQDLAQQALKDLVQQIGTKVSTAPPSLPVALSHVLPPLTTVPEKRQGPNSPIC